jgi:hypothetical protein
MGRSLGDENCKDILQDYLTPCKSMGTIGQRGKKSSSDRNVTSLKRNFGRLDCCMGMDPVAVYTAAHGASYLHMCSLNVYRHRGA